MLYGFPNVIICEKNPGGTQPEIEIAMNFSENIKMTFMSKSSQPLRVKLADRPSNLEPFAVIPEPFDQIPPIVRVIEYLERPKKLVEGVNINNTIRTASSWSKAKVSH